MQAKRLTVYLAYSLMKKPDTKFAVKCNLYKTSTLKKTKMVFKTNYSLCKILQGSIQQTFDLRLATICHKDLCFGYI